MTNDELNQTQFMAEEQIFADNNVMMPDPVVEVKEKPSKKSKKKIAIIVGLVIFFLLLILLLLLKMKKKPIKQTEDLVKEVVNEELTPMQEKIKDLQDDLEVADPSNQNLTFPPVDLELRLDKVER